MTIKISRQRSFTLTEPTASGKEVVFVGMLHYYSDVEERRFMEIHAASTGQFPYSEAMNSGYLEKRNDHLERLHPEEEAYVQQELIKAIQADIQQYTENDLLNPEKRKLGARYEFPRGEKR